MHNTKINSNKYKNEIKKIEGLRLLVPHTVH